MTNADSSRTNAAPCKRFSYDNSTGVLNAIPSGVTVNNPMGRLVEAETDNCSAYPPTAQTMITDEWFSYSPRGELTDIWEYTVNSGVYVHLSATYWADRQLNTISGLGLPTITYGVLDGEGRVQSVANGLVSNVTYNTGNYPNQPIGALMSVTLGSGDSESFTYDPNTRWMTSYSVSVGSTPTLITGSLNWNPNGTLQQLTITDGYNSLDTQTCNYLYDDFIRIASGIDGTPGVNCMNGATRVWNQTFSYDAFGNITKSSTGPGLSWACAACYNTSNNQYNNVLSPNITYDGNGNLTNDTFHTYTWFPDGHVASIDGKNTITYDANGNKVEENVGTIHQYVYGFGVTAQMTGSTENATTVDLPGGLQALFSGGTVQRYRYPDWQGTIRAESSLFPREFTESLAFAPFGERYAQLGYPYNVDSFTGKPDQIVPDEYDFPAREEHNGQGRWISPDPMRGTGNKYVYADNNPLSKVDIYGMYSVVVNGLEVDTEDSILDAAAYSIAESKPQQSQQTGGQVGASPSGNGQAASSTQSPEKHQQDEQKQSHQQGQQEQEQQKTLADKAKAVGNEVVDAISGVSDFLNEHPFLSLALTLGGSFEKDEPAIEECVESAASSAETEVEALEQEAGSVFSRLNLSKSLASQQQMSEISSGGGTKIAGGSARRAIDDIAQLTAQYGGSAKDWVKVASSNFKAADGTSFETHAYRNVTTGQVVEWKTKFQ